MKACQLFFHSSSLRIGSLVTLVTTAASNPADFVKTRVMNESASKMSSMSFFLKFGNQGFMKGWAASYLFELEPIYHTIIFESVERIRQLMGMETY